MKEVQLQREVLDLLAHLPNTYFFRTSTGLIKTERGNWFRTGKKGLPDICGVIDGKFYGLEIKVGKNKLSIFQQQAKEEIEKAGGEYWEVRSLNDVIKKLGV